MEINFLIEKTSLLILYIITVSTVFISIMIGFGFGRYIKKKNKYLKESKLGSIIGAMLGLLAFILAFTFGSATFRFDAKKQLLLEEVNAIGTTFLRTNFLPESEHTEARELIKQYVNLRVD